MFFKLYITFTFPIHCFHRNIAQTLSPVPWRTCGADDKVFLYITLMNCTTWSSFFHYKLYIAHTKQGSSDNCGVFFLMVRCWLFSIFYWSYLCRKVFQLIILALTVCKAHYFCSYCLYFLTCLVNFLHCIHCSYI